MKKILLVLLCVLSINGLFAQQPNAKVLQALSNSEIAKLQPAQVDYLNFLSENLVIISSMPEKAVGLADFSTIRRKDGKATDLKTLDLNQFNPLLFVIPIQKDKVTAYKFGDTGKVITVLSQDRLDVLYERYKSNNAKK